MEGETYEDAKLWRRSAFRRKKKGNSSGRCNDPFFVSVIALSHIVNGSIPPPYLNVSQLTPLNGKTIGTVIDTEELQIDVVNIMSSGYEANITLRVTAKQMDTVLHDSGWEDVALNNYRFSVDNHGTLFQNASRSSCQYVYSNTESLLLPNQFYLIFSVFSLDGFDEGPYSIILQGFGYYNKSPNSQDNVGITAFYEGPWIINLVLSGDTENSKTLFVNQIVSIGDRTYTIEKIYLTPFSCTAVISDEKGTELLMEDFSKISSNLSDLKLYTIDGQFFKDAQPIVVGGKEIDQKAIFYVSVEFDAPINIDAVRKISLVGRDFEMTMSEFALE